jgi:hypothetical protein
MIRSHVNETHAESITLTRLVLDCLRCEQLGNEVCLYPVIALKA